MDKVTKWDILTERMTSLRNQADNIQKELDSLKATPFGSICTYCNEMLETEADFAKHFIVPNRAYLNLGECPRKPED